MRFPGFEGEWKQEPISHIAPLQRGFDLPTVKISQGEYPIVYSNGILRYHNEYKCIAPGVVTGRSGTIGKFTYIPTGFYWPHNTALWVTDFCGNSPIFIYYLYQTLNIEQYATGSGVPTLNRNDVHRHKASVPSNEEQEKIAKFLQFIDERIATQNKIINDLKKLKSAIYDNIFNSLEGETFSLADVADIIKGKQVNGEFLTEAGDYYVMNGGVEPSGYYHAFNVSANTISISEGGNSCGYIQWNSVPFWSGGHCYTLNIKEASVENKYLYHFLKWSEPEIMKLRIGSGLPNIQKKDLERVSIIIPTNSTQREIIDLVDSFDGKIDTEYSISLLLNHQKTYLLSKLFI